MNVCTLIGRTGQDPESRVTQNGTKVVNISLATRGYKRDETDWHRLIVFGKLAETFEKYVRKGDQIGVSGRITYRSWEDREGTKRYATEIVVSDLELLGSPQKDRAPEATQGAGGGSLEEDLNDSIPFSLWDDWPARRYF